jgi:hypothetical protein
MSTAAFFWNFYRELAGRKPWDLAQHPAGFPGPDQINGRASDEAAHMPMLRFLASMVGHAAEFGCREGSSTAAILAGLAEGPLGDIGYATLDSYDIAHHPAQSQLASMALPAKWRVHHKDTASGDWRIDPTDYLHVDGLHTYAHVKRELEIHGCQVRRFLSFHDTYGHGRLSLDRPGEEGILRAIEEYTAANGWKLVYSVDFNHGLRVYERR